MNLKTKYILLPCIQCIIPVVLLFFGPYIGLHPKGPHGRLIQLLGGTILVLFMFTTNFFLYRREKRFKTICDNIRSRFKTNDPNEIILVSEPELQALGGGRRDSSN